MHQLFDVHFDLVGLDFREFCRDKIHEVVYEFALEGNLFVTRGHLDYGTSTSVLTSKPLGHLFQLKPYQKYGETIIIGRGYRKFRAL